MAKARTAKCYQAAMAMSKGELAKLEKAAQAYNTGDEGADFAAAANDELARLKSLRSAIQTALAEKARAAAPKMSKAATTATGNTADAVAKEVYAFLPIKSDRLVVVNNTSELPADIKAAYDAEFAARGGKGQVKGFVWDGKAYLIAENIQPGTARSIFMHEVGVHVGMAEGMTQGEMDGFAQSVLQWAQDNDGSRESNIAKLALDRARASGSNPADYLEEVVAYFVEEAIKAGVNPTAEYKKRSKLGVWFEKVRKTIEAALARFFGEAPGDFTMQDMVDIAYAKAAQAMVRSRDAQDKAKNPADAVPKFSLSKDVESAARRVAGPSGAMIAGSTTQTVEKLANSMMFLHDIVDKFKTTVPAIGNWYEQVQASMATRRQLEQDAEEIAAAAEKLKGGTERVNDFISRSTFEQKWGYDPQFGRTVTVDPAMRQAFNNLTQSERDIVRAVFAHGEKMKNVRNQILKAAGLQGQFTMPSASLNGPYAPLKRFGDYIGVLKSKDLIDAERRGDTKAIERFKADSRHYVMSHFDTAGQAKQFAWENQTANGGRYEFSDAFEKSERVNEVGGMDPKALQQVLAALGVNPQVPASAKAAVEKMVQDMYLSSLDEQHARTSGMKRMNRAGYDKDMIRSFLSHARSEAGFLSNIKHGKAINSEFLNMQNQARNTVTRQREFQNGVNTVAQHYADSLNYKETPWQDRAMALTSAWQLATSLGYHLTNASQGFMVSLPKLAADFDDYAGAWKHLTAGYGMVKHTGMWGNIDLNKVPDAGLRAALQRASDMGVLDVGMDEDLTHFEATKTGIAGIDRSTKLARSALHRLRQVSRGVETANRVAAATAAYTMARSKGKSVADAQQYAIRMLQSTQGDFSRIGSPLLLKKLPKMMTQYKKYQFMMAALYAKAFMQAFRSADPKERAIGRRMLAYKLFHTGVAAGVLGMPLINMVSAVWGFLGDDDEPRDLERDLRDLIGDDTLSELLLHGIPAMMGVDISGKLGDDKIFSILPYGEWDFSSRQGFSDMLFSLAGPAFSQAGRFADGFGMLGEGEYYKATEKFMPKGVSDAMKSWRIANEGYTLKNGDLMVGPEDAGSMAMIADAIGIPSTHIKNLDWIRSQQYEIGEHFQQRTRSIQKDYVKAFQDGDTAKMMELRQDWLQLQSSKDALRHLFNGDNEALKKQPLSALITAPRRATQREQKLQSSVPATN